MLIKTGLDVVLLFSNLYFSIYLVITQKSLKSIGVALYDCMFNSF